ncbi:MAG: hypothetical protein WC197_06400 [Candidatus Gastranaerophilaceae bacterium]|jgi:uncharacterized protein (DUF983 family)
MINKEIKVTCPGCNVTYIVESFEEKAVRCMDCGCIYNQRTCSTVVIDWIRKKIITCGSC